MTTPSTTPRPLTDDIVVDAMTHGYFWNLDSSRTLNWSLADGFNSEYWLDPSSVVETLSTAFAVFSYYADVKFNYVGYFTDPSAAYTGGSDITVSLDSVFISSVLGDSAWAIGFPSNASYDSSSELYTGAAGDIFLNINSDANALPSYDPGSAGFSLALHEIGHTLGLKHPHDDGGTGHPTFSDAGFTDLDFDWATVMSYADDFNWNLTSYDPATPMVLDVLALQYIYGVNTATNAGNTTYTLPLNNLYATIWDASGIDTVNVAAATVAWTIALPSLQLSALVSTLAGFAVPTAELDLASPKNLYWLTGDIENVTGSRFNDDLTGNQLNNTLNGGLGTDLMAGAGGNDIYIVNVAGDVVTEAENEGRDTVKSGITWALGANLENLTLTGAAAINGTGNALNNVLTGNAAVNILSGGMGNDTLDGGASADKMTGGAGNDIYIINVAGDIVTEAAAAGTDTVKSGVTWTLGANIENLILTGASAISGTGNTLNNTLIGNAAVNTLNGGSGNDTLDGGAGADRLNGGAGNDTYIVNVTGDIVTEAAAAGTDTVKSGVTWTLGANIENLILTGASAIGGTGNTLNNTLTGNAAANTLKGGSGNDTLDGARGLDFLWGGLGADTFVFKAASAYNNADVIKDFSSSRGDKLDISDLLSGTDPLVQALADFVQFANSGTNSKLSIDRDGLASTYAWTQIATLEGITGLTDEAALVANGILLVG